MSRNSSPTVRRRRRNVLTPALIGEIRAARGRGEHYSVLARRHGISEGTVRNAMKAPAPPPTDVSSPHEDGPSDTSTTPPTQEDVRRWLGEQVAGLRADVDRLRKAGDRPGLAAANRQLVAASSLLARVTPPDPKQAPEGFVLVSAQEMEEQGRQLWEGLHQKIDRYTEYRSKWPKCATCDQPVRPKHWPRDEELSPADRLVISIVETSIAKQQVMSDLVAAVGPERARMILADVVATTLSKMEKS